MTYKLTYTDDSGSMISILQISDVIYDEILNTVKTSDDTNKVLSSVTDLFPDDLGRIFKERFGIEEEE